MKNETDIQIASDLLFEPDTESTFINKSEEVSQRKIDLDLIRDLNRRFENRHPDELLSWGYREFGREIVLGTGFGLSGVYLIHRLVTQQIPIRIFYLDTHLLFNETYQLRDKIEARFGIEVERVSTNLTLDEQAETYGGELWKSDPDRCCHIRKVLPLKNYLTDKRAWITGVRRNQAVTRKKTQVIEWDPLNEVIKINPLATWSNDDVWEYINKHNLPYNPLHDSGYPTIGCIPCTEPVEGNEHERDGRWKNNTKTECGIHLPTQNFKNGHHSK
ncbi:phosphoadenylyl-sulfate reductase [Rhodohalobacter sp. SW132]|uniref:phosphoadenylyl-sulfate reductase n=1 Tax=Rhodohalobacter sp. SW132 TaxID=2293433 RepID=UPI000E24CD1E|nr:phosphoadenylyl-sulfate reductase [Rhodohalobacter sp. SW132]REL33243.1 phosphoadenylyl-sulfate reductase [Rhodohalobacter sp. SW132]